VSLLFNRYRCASAAWLVLSAPTALACSSSEAGAPATSSSAGTSPAQAGTASTSATGGTGDNAGGNPSGGSNGGQAVSSGGASGASGAASVTGGAGSGSEGSAGAAGASAGAGGAATPPGLVPSPSELVFAAVQQTQSPPQTITLDNPSASAAELGAIELDTAAPGTGSFELVSAPPAGTKVAAGASASVQIRFHPTGIAEFQSALSIETTSPPAKLKVALFGLGTKGLEGANEPFLKAVLDTLGFAINVGSAGLLGINAQPVGDEVAAPRFKAASAAEVELTPVARYSPQERIPYGYYNGATEVEVGVIASDQYQALNPTTEPGAKLSFAAAAGEFGIFTSSKTHKTYSEDAKNAANATQHAVRTYPLKDRAGAAVPSAYLVCFEEAANGDYQDYVFTLKNVVPVAP
jgi:hypothetical protein